MNEQKTEQTIMFIRLYACSHSGNIINIMFFLVLLISCFIQHCKHNIFWGFIGLMTFRDIMNEPKINKTKKTIVFIMFPECERA